MPQASITALHPTSGTDVTVRRAQLLDVPGMVRALKVEDQLLGEYQEQVQRALRLTFTHVALEHGAAWVALDADGVIRASSVALPSWELAPRNELGDILDREAGIEPPPGQVEENLPIMRLRGLGRFWVIARPAPESDEEPAGLLAEAAAWALERASEDQADVLLVGSSAQDKADGIALGFAEVAGALPEPLWLGLKTVERSGRKVLTA